MVSRSPPANFKVMLHNLCTEGKVKTKMNDLGKVNGLIHTSNRLFSVKVRVIKILAYNMLSRDLPEIRTISVTAVLSHFEAPLVLFSGKCIFAMT